MPSEPDLVPVGRVGRPHGVDGSFFVEGPSDRPERFANGATLFVGGEPAKVVVSKRGSASRGTARVVPRSTERSSLITGRPPLEEDEYYSFQLVGLAVEEEGGRVLGQVKDVLDYPANDVLELDSGVLLPLVEACVRQVDLEGGRIVVSVGFADPE